MPFEAIGCVDPGAGDDEQADLLPAAGHCAGSAPVCTATGVFHRFGWSATHSQVPSVWRRASSAVAPPPASLVAVSATSPLIKARLLRSGLEPGPVGEQPPVELFNLRPAAKDGPAADGEDRVRLVQLDQPDHIAGVHPLHEQGGQVAMPGPALARRCSSTLPRASRPAKLASFKIRN